MKRTFSLVAVLLILTACATTGSDYGRPKSVKLPPKASLPKRDADLRAVQATPVEERDGEEAEEGQKDNAKEDQNVKEEEEKVRLILEDETGDYGCVLLKSVSATSEKHESAAMNMKQAMMEIRSNVVLEGGNAMMLRDSSMEGRKATVSAEMLRCRF